MRDPSSSSAERVEWIDVRGQRVLEVTIASRLEFEARATLRAVAAQLAERPLGSVLLLADLRAAVFLPRVALEWQQLQQPLGLHCRRIAALRARGSIAGAAKAFLAVAQQMGHPLAAKVKFFHDVELAQHWLLDDLRSER